MPANHLGLLPGAPSEPTWRRWDPSGGGAGRRCKNLIWLWPPLRCAAIFRLGGPLGRRSTRPCLGQWSPIGLALRLGTETESRRRGRHPDDPFSMALICGLGSPLPACNVCRAVARCLSPIAGVYSPRWAAEAATGGRLASLSHGFFFLKTRLPWPRFHGLVGAAGVAWLAVWLSIAMTLPVSATHADGWEGVIRLDHLFASFFNSFLFFIFMACPHLSSSTRPFSPLPPLPACRVS